MTIAGRRYIICRNQEQARKDAIARAELERELTQGVKSRRWSPTRGSAAS